jgi:hypothetical protein
MGLLRESHLLVYASADTDQDKKRKMLGLKCCMGDIWAADASTAVSSTFPGRSRPCLRHIVAKFLDVLSEVRFLL